MFKYSLLVAVCMCTTGINLFAQVIDHYNLSSDSLVNFHASQKKSYSATRLNEKPKIDGRLNDVCWAKGNWSGGFIQQQPLQAQNPSQESEICVLYDDKNIYVAIKCHDTEPGKIRSILSRRDEFGGDMAGIAFDSYNDNRSAFEFNLSAAGQKVDLVHLDAYEWDVNWDAVWDGKSQVGDSMWTAEMRIPFSQLRFAKAEEQVWGMHVWRWIDRFQEEDQWKLIPIDAPEMVYLFGELNGIKGIDPKRKFEFLPYANAKFSPNTELNEKSEFGFGLDGKIGLSSDFTLDYTVNPDFGQVEADPSVLSLSSYEVFYDEKRPFFLEGNNILDYSMGRDLMFYSRRIGRAPIYVPSVSVDETLSTPDNTSIISAVKVTGKSKKGLSVGVVQSFTANEEATIKREAGNTDVSVEPFTSFFVGRLKQDFNKGNTVLGGMLTSTIRDINDEHLEFLPKSSLAGGIDFQHNWKNRKYFLDMKGFFSQIEGSELAISRLQRSPQHNYQREDASHLDYDPEKTSLFGHGGEIEGGKRSGKFRAIGSFSWRSPGIDFNDMGYLRQADFIKEELELRYQVNEPKGILRNYWFRFQQKHEWSYGGESTKEELGLRASLRFTNLWSLNLNFERDYNVFDTRELRGGPKLFIDNLWEAQYYLQTNASKDLHFLIGTTFIDYDDGISERYFNTFRSRWQINDRLSISARLDFDKVKNHHQYANRVSLQDGSTGYLVGTLERRTLDAQLRLEYFVTPELSIQYYANPYASVGKYDDFRRVVDGDNKDLSQRYLSLVPTSGNNVHNFNEASGDEYSIYNPDFDYQEFRSNLVARWEFRPGSTLYLVWNTSGINVDQMYRASVSDSFGDTFGLNTDNVFMIKFNYWFSL